MWHVCPGEELRATLRSTRAIEAGEEVLIAYVDPSQPWWLRQAALQSSHGFRCACPVCAEITGFLTAPGSAARPVRIELV